MYQPSLFASEEEPISPGYVPVGAVMRQRLLTCLEHAVGAIEVMSDLPKYEDGVWMGVTYREHRREKICRGSMSHPELLDACKLSSMLLWSVAQFVLFRESTMHHLKMKVIPPQSLIKEVALLLEEYTQAGGQIGERQAPMEYPPTPTHLSKKEQQDLEISARKYEEEAALARGIEERMYTAARAIYPGMTFHSPFAGPCTWPHERAKPIPPSAMELFAEQQREERAHAEE